MSKVKSKTKLIIIIASAIIVLCLAFLIFSPGKKEANAEAPSISVSSLVRRPLVDSIPASGSVVSMKSTNIYSTLNAVIDSIPVEVGDSVSVGTPLALLDDVSIKNQIKQSENSLLSATDSLDSGYISAKTSFENAKSALERQTLSYNTMRDDFNNGTSSSLLASENTTNSSFIAWENAVKDLERKEKDHVANIRLYEAGALSKSALDSSEDALRIAQNTVNTTKAAYDKALIDLSAAKSSQSSNLEIARLDLEAAKLTYNNAARTLENYNSGTSTADGNLENQRLSLETLQQQLDDTVIKSSVNGVVTESNAIVGGGASGILFVVEDTKDLYVTVRVKEYNLSKISIGQKATITADAVNTRIFDGEVIYISPKAVTQAGDTSVEFEVRVRIIDVDDNLVKIGMNASVNIIIDSRDDAYAVFYDSIVNIPDEGSYIYIFENGKVDRVQVETGMKTDMYVEISGEGLKDGMTVISNPSLVEVGQVLDESTLVSPRTFVSPNSGDVQPGEMRQGAVGGGEMIYMSPAGGAGGAVRVEGGGPAMMR